MTAQKRPAKRTMTEPGLGQVDPNARRRSTSGDMIEATLDRDRSPESSPPVESRRLTRTGVPSVPVSENATPSAPPVLEPPTSQPPTSQASTRSAPPVRSEPPVASARPARAPAAGLGADAAPDVAVPKAARPVSTRRDLRADSVPPAPVRRPDRISTRRDLRIDEDAPRTTAPDSTRPVASSGAKPARRGPSAPPAATGSSTSSGSAGTSARTVPLTREAREARAERDATDARDGSSASSRRPTMRNPPEPSAAALANAAAATARRPAFKADKVESAPPPRTDTRRRTVSEDRSHESPRAPRTSVRVDHVPIESAVKAGGPDSIRVAARSVPRLLLTKAEIAVAPIDHRAGFLLAYIDGTTTVQGLVDIEVMPENEVHEILDRLRRLGIVAIR